MSTTIHLFPTRQRLDDHMTHLKGELIVNRVAAMSVAPDGTRTFYKVLGKPHDARLLAGLRPHVLKVETGVEDALWHEAVVICRPDVLLIV